MKTPELKKVNNVKKRLEIRYNSIWVEDIMEYFIANDSIPFLHEDEIYRRAEKSLIKKYWSPS